MKRIIIIGAGPAGLTAGCELLKRTREYEVILLEETGQIGGISRTVSYHGNRMDIGGHRFFSKDERVREWWETILPEQGEPAYDDKKLERPVTLKVNGPDPEKEDLVMLNRRRVSRIYYRHHFFDYPIKINWNTICGLGFTAVTAGFSYMKAVFRRLPENSLENFYRNRFGNKLYTMFFEGYTEKLWGRHPSAISPDWGAQRVKGLSIMVVLKDMAAKVFSGKSDGRKVETSLIKEFRYPKYGPGQLWEQAAEQYRQMGGQVYKNCRVTGITAKEGKICSVVCEYRGEIREYEGDIFLSSMPLKDLVAGMKAVPPDIAAIAAGLPYRDFVTVGLLVKGLELKNRTKQKTLNGLIPDCWVYVQDTGVKLGRIQVFNNWSPYMAADPENTVWLGLEYFCMEGDADWNREDAGWAELGMSELVQMGVIAPGTELLDSHVEKVKKAYPAYFDTYAQIDELIKWLNSWENLYCIGRNGQHRYNNMDHSMATAFEAVESILEGGRDKTAIWNVNTEKTYHETEGGAKKC